MKESEFIALVVQQLVEALISFLKPMVLQVVVACLFAKKWHPRPRQTIRRKCRGAFLEVSTFTLSRSGSAAGHAGGSCAPLTLEDQVLLLSFPGPIVEVKPELVSEGESGTSLYSSP